MFIFLKTKDDTNISNNWNLLNSMHWEIHVFWINLISQNYYTLLDVKLYESKKYISYA